MNTYSYDFINRYNARRKPSTVHSQENATTWYFRRYLIQKIISVFEFDGIPKDWSKDYFLYTLFVNGFVAIVNTDKFGVIPQHCNLYGYDVFYRPTNVNIANPLLRGNLTPRIGTQCALIRMQPDYGSCWDIVAYYADLLAMSTEALAVNITNSKLAYVFACEDKTVAESFKKMYDQLQEGNPAVFADKKLFLDDGSPAWDTFQNNLKQNYIAKDILEDMTKIDARFCTEIGIPNVNMAKESGVTDNEVEANNIDTKTKASLWLETIKDGLKQANDMFGLNISVKFRYESEVSGNVAVDNGNV
ncbi:MAG: hypothetical protein IIY21_00610 [Clostridiales bacterium]|nr:hypothetical protein [Clostridiales bacterium]